MHKTSHSNPIFDVSLFDIVKFCFIFYRFHQYGRIFAFDNRDSFWNAVTELSAADKLEEFRKEQDEYLWQSFEPICASAEHAAIVHYSATKDSNVPVTENGLFLTDTGGGYLEGSTDITRTFAFGNVPQNMKEDFTSVLLCNLHLANIVFPYGTTGGSLDVIGRLPLWKRGLDFNHGTGHGVGYLMNIHEEPARFRRYLGNKAQFRTLPWSRE